MTDITETAPPPAGHNLPPEAVGLVMETLKNVEKIERGAIPYLEIEYADLMRRLKEILETVARGLPSKIDEKGEAEKISDLRYAIKKWISAAKSARTAEKKPWSGIGNIFFAWFTRPIEQLEEIDDKKLGPVLQDWQDRETARVRREAEAEAARLREEADKRTKEAAEAETRKLAAEKAEREAKEREAEAIRRREEEQRAQAEAKARKEREEKEAAEAAERAKVAAAERAEQDRLAAEARARRQADEAASAIARAEEESANQRAADAKMREEDADRQRKESEARAATAQREEQEAKDRVKAAAAQQKEAERGQIDARKDIRAATKDEKIAFSDAERADKKADKQEDIAGDRAANLSRVRGEAGSVSSLRTFKNFRNLDRLRIDLEQLRGHIPLGALETAIRSFIDAGGNELRGVEIYDDTGTTTR